MILGLTRLGSARINEMCGLEMWLCVLFITFIVFTVDLMISLHVPLVFIQVTIIEVEGPLVLSIKVPFEAISLLRPCGFV